MKKFLALLLAMAMMLAMAAGCGNTASVDPDPAPNPEPESEPSSAAVEAPPAAVEGVVKEASEGKLIIALEDGTNLAMDTSGIADLEVRIGDTVKAEYTGEIGSIVATRVEVTVKAEVVIFTIAGVVTKIEDGFVFLTLENGTEAALRTVSMEEGEVEVGDTLTVYYTNDPAEGVDGMTVVSVDVTKAEKKPKEEQKAPDTTASQAGQGSAVNSGSSTSSGAAASSGGAGSSYDGMDLGEWYRQFLKDIPEVEDEDDDDYTFPSQSSQPAPIEPEPPADAGDVYEAVRLINIEREKVGLHKLEIDPELMAMAQVRADEQPASFGHTRPDGSTWTTIFEEYGYTYSFAVENAGAGTNRAAAAAQVDGWMNSPGHKANNLNPEITKIGIGYCYDSNSQYKHYWAMIGAKPR